VGVPQQIREGRPEINQNCLQFVQRLAVISP
jgi:hypothetical protein